MAEEDLFYGDKALTTARCRNGLEIKFSLTMLQRRVSKFNNVSESDKIDFTNYYMPAVRMFFDIVMGFKKLDEDESLRILPIVLQYNIEDLLQKCVSCLKITAMDEDVIRILNMAINKGCEELIDIVLDFLKLYGGTRLFLAEQYYLLLEPKSVAVLLRIFPKNTFILQSVVNWGRKYIEKHNIDLNLQTFFSRHSILNKLSVNCLESFQSVLAFYEIGSEENIFTEKEMVKHMKELSLTENKCYQWEHIEERGTVVESFALKFFISLRNPINIIVEFNPAICELIQTRGKLENCHLEVFVDSTVHNIEKIENKHVFRSSCHKIFLSEATGLAKSQINVTIKKEGDYFNHLKDVTITYTFHKNCKILKSKIQLNSLWSMNPQKVIKNGWCSTNIPDTHFTSNISFC